MRTAKQMQDESDWVKAGEAIATQMLSTMSDLDIDVFIESLKIGIRSSGANTSFAIAAVDAVTLRNPILVLHAVTLMVVRERLRRSNAKSENE